MKMDDIAQLANVSKSAVSIALNNRPGVSDETRQRILKIVKEQNYSPQHRLHKAPAKSILHFITISPEDHTQQATKLPFFASLIAEFSVITQQKSIGLQIENLEPAQLADRISTIDEDAPGYFGTIVLATALNRKQVESFTKALKRVLILDAPFKNLSVNAVSIDNYLGGYCAANELLKRGYEDIGYVAAREPYPNYLERQQGFNARLAEAQMKIHLKYQVGSMTMNQDSDMATIFTKPLPRAFFCDNDYIAIRLMRLAQQKGLKIPQDLAIMGFDDIGEGRVTSPDLTTVHVPVTTIAKVAVSRLQEIKDNQLVDYHLKQYVQPQVTIRHSI
ncbi:LacI family DNA-binding transcriptional regulator [Lactiplantibacillus pingfangensis]|uniref:LacI family DNA-binding transcriptional regulator n=1 Tax=Lactiplantibacillus pingfangensis TaxID=2559915 RepID=UPI001485BF5E|nr:LacI family DNA-binding transcriptional regulator [Lactiplantibacillus pingfangensis]